MRKIFFSFLLLAILFPAAVWAKVGVGVGTGKVVVQDKLRPGMIYELPSLTVINTGDEGGEYEVDVSYLETQSQLRPAKSWFGFSPSKFRLEPEKVQEVKIKVNIPIMAAPGEYFAYLEGRPMAKSQSGATSIGVAAAAKLYFTIVPANPLFGIYYKIVSIWKVYAPWPQAFLILLVIVVVFRIARRRLSIQIGLKDPKTNNPEQGGPRKSQFRKLE